MHPSMSHGNCLAYLAVKPYFGCTEVHHLWVMCVNTVTLCKYYIACNAFTLRLCFELLLLLL